MFKNIRKMTEEINALKKGTRVIYDDPDFGKVSAVVEKDSSPYEDTVQIHVIERPMTLYVDKNRIQSVNRDVII